MNKEDIIQQWLEDQKPVNPEALGWYKKEELVWKRGSRNSGTIYTLRCRKDTNKFLITVDYEDCQVDELCVYLNTQGDLRILTNTLNID